MNSQLKAANGRKAANRQAGFSLLELVVTMGIMVVILGAVSRLMADALRTSVLVNETTEAQQSLRASHEFLTRDLLSAGDGLSGLDAGRIQVPLNFVKTYVTATPNSAQVNAGNANASYVPLPLITADNDESRASAATGLLPETDRLTMLKEVPDPSFPVSIIGGNTTNFTKPNAGAIVAAVPSTTAALLRPGEVVLVVSSTTGNAVFAAVSSVTTGSNAQITFATGDGYGLNTAGLPLLTAVVWPNGYSATTPSNSVSVLRVQLVTYFVDADGLLRRRVLGNPRRGDITPAAFAARAMEGEIIAEHVSDLQVRYGLVNPSDRDAWERVDQLSATQQPHVREVEVKVTAETPHKILKDGERAKATSVARTSVRTMEYRNSQ